MRKRLGLGLGLNFNMRSCFQIKWAGFRTTKITSLCGEAYYTKQKIKKKLYCGFVCFLTCCLILRFSFHFDY
jgi:hypothetical protein